MKRISAIFLALASALALCSCGASSHQSQSASKRITSTMSTVVAPTPISFTVTISSSAWAQIVAFVNSPNSGGVYSSPADFVNQSTCGYPADVSTALPRVTVSPGARGEIVTVSLSGREHYWYDQTLSSQYCSVTSPQQDYSSSLTDSAIKSQIASDASLNSSTSSNPYPCSSCYSGPTLTWSTWVQKASIVFANANFDMTSCSDVPADDQALYDLGNAAPDSSQTIYDDIANLVSDLQSTSGVYSCSGFGGPQSSWNQDLQQLNSDLARFGQPSVP